VLNFC